MDSKDSHLRSGEERIAVLLRTLLGTGGKNPAEFPFVTKDPGVAATGMQTGGADFKSIMVLEPVRDSNSAQTL